MWVSNLTGGSYGEVAAITAVAPLVALVHSLLASLYYEGVRRRVGEGVGETLCFLLDVLIMVGPLILAFTLDNLTALYALLLLLALLLLWVRGGGMPKGEALDALNADKKPFLGCFRSFMVLSTCIAILAVDFPIFPRRHAKTETSGLSLMDIGVGGFVISLGLVSRRARPAPSAPLPLLARLSHSLRLSFPIFILGFLRFFLLKLVQYPEHTSEYGAHWNFFTTLAFLTLLATLLELDPRGSLLLGGAVLAAHQAGLSLLGVEEYVHSGAPRENLFAANREGISSLPGYLGMFLIAIFIGSTLLQKRRSVSEWLKFGMSLLVISLVLPVVAYLSPFLASRKVVNVSYVLYCFSLTLLPLSLFLICEILVPGYQNPSKFLKVISEKRNSQLVFFLVSNVGTGIINMLIQTLFCSSVTSYFVLFAYMIISMSLATFLVNKLHNL
uniref:Phosphatidylinositol-glycan biosynthesis class W protein n=1 Tax=Arcella intermedia TaxID=1963864 RepID=A0A6B2L4H1_9EUKA